MTANLINPVNFLNPTAKLIYHNFLKKDFISKEKVSYTCPCISPI